MVPTGSCQISTHAPTPNLVPCKHILTGLIELYQISTHCSAYLANMPPPHDWIYLFRNKLRGASISYAWGYWLNFEPPALPFFYSQFVLGTFRVVGMVYANNTRCRHIVVCTWLICPPWLRIYINKLMGTSISYASCSWPISDPRPIFFLLAICTRYHKGGWYKSKRYIYSQELLIATKVICFSNKEKKYCILKRVIKE